MHIIFVYGTLRKGNELHSILRDSEFITDAESCDPMIMISNGMCPMVFEGPFGDNAGLAVPIQGEIYNVGDADFADLEQVEKGYTLVEHDFVTSEGVIHEAGIWVGGRSLGALLVSPSVVIQSGDWNDRDMGVMDYYFRKYGITQ